MHHGIGHMVGGGVVTWPGGRSGQHLPPPPWTTPPSPPARVKGHNTSPLDNTTLAPPPPGQHLPPQAMVKGHNTSPRDYAQAGGTHPIGMHSCLFKFQSIFSFIYHHCETEWEFSNPLEKDKIYWTSCTMKNDAIRKQQFETGKIFNHVSSCCSSDSTFCCG